MENTRKPFMVQLKSAQLAQINDKQDVSLKELPLSARVLLFIGSVLGLVPLSGIMAGKPKFKIVSFGTFMLVFGLSFHTYWAYNTLPNILRWKSADFEGTNESNM
jgi:hypothetical protein